MNEGTSTLFEMMCKDLLGRFAWNGRSGVGSFLLMDFGDPQLAISSHVRSRKATAVGLPKARCRSADLRGSYHLWIYMCAWTADVQGSIVESTTANSKELEALAVVLSGQRLLTLTLRRDGSSEFCFDLSTKLLTRSEQEDDENWLLYDWHSDRVWSFIGGMGRLTVSRIDAQESLGEWAVPKEARFEVGDLV
jgi:hypothetical protein